MNKEKQRIKIAEACGWKPDDDGAGLNTWEASWMGNKLYGLRPSLRRDGTISSYTVDCLVPDYLNNLNAMHEAEKVIIDRGLMDGFEGYHNTLCGIIDNGNAIRATAEQRAEAFLRVLDLWEEES